MKSRTKRKTRKKADDMLQQYTSVGLDSAKAGVLTLAGYGAAEAAGNYLGNTFDFLDTTEKVTVAKSVITIGAAVAAFNMDQYKAEAFMFTGGMAANVTKDLAAMFLPAEVTQYLPAPSLAPGTAGIPHRVARTVPIQNGGGAQFTRGGIAA